MNPSDILTAFYNAGHNYSVLVRPFALHLLAGLILVEILTIGISYMMSGGENPAEVGWQIVRLLFTGGFSYWWLIQSWWLGTIVVGSFDSLGSQITGAPNLAPNGFINIGIAICKILWKAPSSTRVLPNLGLAMGEVMLAILIMLVFLAIGGLAIFTIASMWLIIGPGSILVSFMPCRFTTALSEGYFTWLVRTGVVLLFFYVVLGTCEQFAVQWDNSLVNACGATLTTLPAPVLGGPPVIVHATPCTQPIPLASLLTLLASSVVLAFVAVGVPFTAGAIVGHGVSLVMEHLNSARQLAGSVARPIAGAVAGLSRQVYRMTRSSTQSRLEQRMAAGAAAAAATPRPSHAVTMQLPKPPAVNAFGVLSTTRLNGPTGRQTSKL